MAVTSLWHVKGSIKDVIDYIENPEKTVPNEDMQDFCDVVLLLEDGSITEAGTHQELLDRRGRYYELYEIQSAYYRKNPLGAKGESIDEEEIG